MDGYRKRLEMLTREEQVWEEYTPAKQEDSPDQTNRDSNQMPPGNPSTKLYEDSNSRSLVVSAKSSWGSQEKSALNSQIWSSTGLDYSRQNYATDPKGNLCCHRETFCPWKLVTQYPHIFVGKKNGERVAPFFEDIAIHENRVWYFFYLYNPADLDQKPLLLVPTYQFQDLLDFVNTELKTNLTIPRGKNEEMFVMGFGEQQSPRARFLGRSTTQKAFEDLQMDIPPRTSVDNFEGTLKEEFLDRLEMIFRTAGMRKNKSQKNRLKRIETHKAWGRSLRNVRRHLTIGFLENVLMGLPGVKLVGETVFISIDFEAYEFNQEIITEVGLATFCHEDVQGTRRTTNTQGTGGGIEEYWCSFICARHLRIRENLWARNTRYVKGCATKFNFGKSEFVKCKRVGSFVRNIIEQATFVEPVAGETQDGLVRKRPLVLVFHDSSQDLKYLEALKVDIAEIDNLVEVVDTRDLHQYIQRARNPAKLATVLTSLELAYRNLHNAGNDAVYTMQAMIGLAFQKNRLMERDSLVAKTHPKESDSSALDDEGWISSDNPFHDNPKPEPYLWDSKADAEAQAQGWGVDE